MWMIDPRLLCKNHLLGEHNEIHKHRPSFVKKHSMAGRVGQIEPLSMKSRHDELAKEMLRRWPKENGHASPYEMPDLSYLPCEHRGSRVDTIESMRLAYKKCSECRENIEREKSMA
jgi:hypothetical protein